MTIYRGNAWNSTSTNAPVVISGVSDVYQDSVQLLYVCMIQDGATSAVSVTCSVTDTLQFVDKTWTQLRAGSGTDDDYSPGRGYRGFLFWRRQSSAGGSSVGSITATFSNTVGGYTASAVMCSYTSDGTVGPLTVAGPLGGTGHSNQAINGNLLVTGTGKFKTVGFTWAHSSAGYTLTAPGPAFTSYYNASAGPANQYMGAADSTDMQVSGGSLVPGYNLSGIMYWNTEACYINEPPQAPYANTRPAIIGTPTVGVASSYTAPNVSDGTFLSRQWKKGGVDISGATALTYTPVAGDLGTNLTISETWTNSVGNTTTTSLAKTVGAAAGGAWAQGAAPFIFYQDTAALTTVGNFAAAPTANSVVWCVAVARSGTVGAGMACAMSDNFGDSGGTAWSQVTLANFANDTTFLFWRQRGTGGSGTAMTATWSGTPSAGITRSSVAGFNYIPPVGTTSVSLIASKNLNTMPSPLPGSTAMPNFTGVAGDFLLSWVSLASGGAGTPVSFVQAITGLIAGTGSANGTGAIRNTSSGGSENANFTIPAAVSRISMVAGQWRAVAAPVVTGIPSAWYNYLQSQGSI